MGILKELLIPVILGILLLLGLVNFKTEFEPVTIHYVKAYNEEIEFKRTVNVNTAVNGSYEVTYYKPDGSIICEGNGVAEYEPKSNEAEIKTWSHAWYANNEECSIVVPPYKVRTVWTFNYKGKTYIHEKIVERE